MSADRSQASRRDFLKAGTTAGLGAVLAGRLPRRSDAAALGGDSRSAFKAAPIETVRIGFVGVGGMGSAHVQNLLNIDGVQIKAICDIVEAKVVRAQKWAEEAGQPKPTG
ncbi:MAG: twin-arginine translocation signal domain-containing protein, partial [Candidatus Aminicenantes bacterium]|nr:twin-arginine translocation signal domain-containing protein [Candidatus Aminicenantes bacterium]